MKYPEEVRQFIFDNYVGTSYKDMSRMIKEKFDFDLTPKQIKGFYGNHRLVNGRTGQFVKGQIPPNKGKKLTPEQYEKAKKGFFKPGSKPHNADPVGTIVKRYDGYYQIKVEEPNKWKLCQIYEYEKAYGKIPEGFVLCFKDGDRGNYHIDNLQLVSKAENAVLNAFNLRFSDPELTEIGISIAKLHIAAKERKNECQ